MKFYLLIVTLPLVFALPKRQEIERGIVCPMEQADDSFAELIPSQRDCSVFYKCNRGVPFKIVCPDGLHYNPRQKACDFPERANCQLAVKNKTPIKEEFSKDVEIKIEAVKTENDILKQETQELGKFIHNKLETNHEPQILLLEIEVTKLVNEEQKLDQEIVLLKADNEALDNKKIDNSKLLLKEEEAQVEIETKAEPVVEQLEEAETVKLEAKQLKTESEELEETVENLQTENKILENEIKKIEAIEKKKLELDNKKLEFANKKLEVDDEAEAEPEVEILLKSKLETEEQTLREETGEVEKLEFVNKKPVFEKTKLEKEVVEKPEVDTLTNKKLVSNNNKLTTNNLVKLEPSSELKKLPTSTKKLLKEDSVETKADSEAASKELEIDVRKLAVQEEKLEAEIEALETEIESMVVDTKSLSIEDSPLELANVALEEETIVEIESNNL